MLSKNKNDAKNKKYIHNRYGGYIRLFQVFDGTSLILDFSKSFDSTCFNSEVLFFIILHPAKQRQRRNHDLPLLPVAGVDDVNFNTLPTRSRGFRAVT